MSYPVREPAQPGEAKGEKRAPPPTLLDRLRSLFGIQAASIRDDIEDALDEDSTSDVFSAQERAMLRNVLNLHEIRVEDVMVPRADMIAIDIDTNLKDVLLLFRHAGHSRLPVYGETVDDPKGMVHIRDFIDYITAPAVAAPGDDAPTSGIIHIDMTQTLAQAGIIRPVLFAPPSMQALDLLVRMQATRTHMAVVIDEFGGTDGLVTIEDIVEVIVGDIEDEHDEDELPQVVAEEGGTFAADARAAPEDVSKAVGFSIATAEDEEDIDTLGGLVVSLAGRVPARDEAVTGHAEADFVVLEADPRRVQRVRVLRKPGVARTSAPALPLTLPSGPAFAAGPPRAD